MARRLAAIGVARRRPSPLAAMAAVVALCLRLLWPPLPAPTLDPLDLAAALGEHALCLAAAAANGDAAPRLPQEPAGPAGHSDHDGLGCCAWHGATGFILPRGAAVTRIAFVEYLRDVAAERPIAPRRTASPAQARAPPRAA